MEIRLDSAGSSFQIPNNIAGQAGSGAQRGVVHEFAYDTAGRLWADTAISLGPSPMVANTICRIGTTYDDLGRVEKVTSYWDTAGVSPLNQVEYVYDAWGNVYREYERHGLITDYFSPPYVQYTYADGATGGVAKYVRLVSTLYPDGDHSVGYDYAAGVDSVMSRLSSIFDDVDSDGVLDAGETIFASYKYLGAGRVVTEDYRHIEVKLDYSADNFAALDRFGRVLDQIWTDYGASQTLDEYTYTYDRAGNRLTRDNELHSVFDENYTYDELDRLTDADRADSFDQSWGLDGQGNFAEFDDDGVSQTRTTNAANEIIAINDGDVWIDPTYDAAGNMLTGPKTGDETARLHYQYDAWNRQVLVMADDYTVLGLFQYDGLNRRIQKTAGGSDVHYYYNQQWQMLEERVVNGGTPVSSNQHVFSPDYIDSPIIWRHDGNGDGDYSDAGDLHRYYLSDANHNTTAVVDSVTGDVAARYVYTAYGECTVYTSNWTEDGPSQADGFLYCGYWFDAGTQNYQVRNRYYTVALATWCSRDPIESSPNLYAYVGNNPLARTDPHGLAAVTASQQNCIQDCIAGCNKEYGWYNPQRYICRGYCDNACTGTPDILDDLGSLTGTICDGINALANSKAVKCACGLIGAADLVSSNPVVEIADCACNVLTTLQTACNRGLKGAALMGALTALDCASSGFGALGCAGGAIIGGIGGVGGAIIGCYVGSQIADTLLDIAASIGQNLDQQGKCWPAAQAEACRDLAWGPRRPKPCPCRK